MELTQNERARILCPYLDGIEPIQVKYIDNDGDTNLHLLAGINFPGQVVILSDLDGGISWAQGFEEIGNNLFAILKPLSEISVEDAVEVAKLLGREYELDEKMFPPNPMFRNKPKTPDNVKLANIGRRELGLGSKVSTCEIRFEVADYLRSKGYALPYRGQSLYDLGIAKTH